MPGQRRPPRANDCGSRARNGGGRRFGELRKSPGSSRRARRPGPNRENRCIYEASTTPTPLEMRKNSIFRHRRGCLIDSDARQPGPSSVPPCPCAEPKPSDSTDGLGMLISVVGLSTAGAGACIYLGLYYNYVTFFGRFGLTPSDAGFGRDEILSRALPALLILASIATFVLLPVIGMNRARIVFTTGDTEAFLMCFVFGWTVFGVMGAAIIVLVGDLAFLTVEMAGIGASLGTALGVLGVGSKPKPGHRSLTVWTAGALLPPPTPPYAPRRLGRNLDRWAESRLGWVMGYLPAGLLLAVVLLHERFLPDGLIALLVILAFVLATVLGWLSRAASSTSSS